MADDKKVTVRDLQTFIEAVEFASDQEEWVPSARQWKRIREMINNLEAAPVQPAQSQQPPQFFTPIPGGGMPPPVLPPGGGMPPGPMIAAPSGLSTAQATAPQQPRTMGPSGPMFAQHEQMPVRTPDIDTSNGKYQSSFAS